MKAIIEIEMDNAAFEHNRGGELARILSEVSDKVNLIHNLQNISPAGIRDINGNTVGTFTVEGAE